MLAGAEALVVEAEQLAAGTSIDDAKLPERWQALDRRIRTPALTRRFEAALSVIEQRRLAQIRAADQETHAARQQLHTLLHTAEQALAAGQLQTARAAAEEIRTRRPGAGLLPKPTLQRLSRLTQQLKEFEGWESFGQHQARIQLCERAEAAATLTLDAPQPCGSKCRNCATNGALSTSSTGAYPRRCGNASTAPARKPMRPPPGILRSRRHCKSRHASSARTSSRPPSAHVPTLLVEPRDWRAIERWLRETDRRWRDGDLGSVEPKAWKSLDARLQRCPCAVARCAVRGARPGEGASRGVDRGSHGAGSQSVGSRCAGAGQGDPGQMAGAGEGTGACAARRARALGAVSRRVRRGLRSA